MARDENAEGRNPDDRRAEADAPRTDDELLRKDVSYSPGSDTETAAKQADPIPDQVAEDVDTEGVRAVPGTGGPDDAGDIDVDPDDLNLPFRDE